MHVEIKQSMAVFSMHEINTNFTIFEPARIQFSESLEYSMAILCLSIGPFSSLIRNLFREPTNHLPAFFSMCTTIIIYGAVLHYSSLWYSNHK